MIASPAAKAVPATTAQVWSELYQRGACLMPRIGAGVALAYGYAAYESYSQGSNWKGFVAAAACVVAIVPYTVAVMGKTNAALLEAARGGAAAAASAAQVPSLVDRWGTMNLIRSLLPLAGSLLGMMTFLCNRQ